MPPPKLITPKQFTEATALGVFSPRGPETQAMDRAYEAYYKQASVILDPASPKLRVVSLNLLQALTTLVLAKGGNWELVNRDKASKGLLREWHRWLELQWGADLARTLVKEKAALGWDLIHSRFGVVYLLSNLQIDVDWRIMLGEAVAQGGSAIVAGSIAGTGGAATFGEGTVDLGLGKVSASALTSGASAATTLLKTAASHPTAKVPDKKAERFEVPQKELWTTSASYPKSVTDAFPCTADLFKTAVKQYEGVSDIPGMIVGGAIATPIALATDLLKTLAESLWKALHDLVNWIKKKMWADDEFAAKTIASVAKPIIALVIQKVCEAAAPFVGGAMQIATGVAKTVKAAVDKIALWWDKSMVKLTEGHFALIGESVEHQLTKGLLYGLWTALKGAGDIAMNSFLPGAGSLVSMIMGGIEWLTKAICRLVDHHRIDHFLLQARNLWDHEKTLARKVPHETSKELFHYEPPENASTGSIVHDTQRFSAFFKRGCSASAVIPMITLNSGMCGGIFQQIEVLISIPGGMKCIDKKVFDAGVSYFDRLKRISHEYLVTSGFRFSSRTKELEGVVHHACFDHHLTSTGMKILTALAT